MHEERRGETATDVGPEVANVEYRALTEHAHDLISEISTDGRVLYASPNHAELLGLDPVALIGKSVLDGLHPDDVAGVAQELSRAVASNQSTSVEHRYRDAGGQFRWLESSGRTYRADDGTMRVVVVSRDVTARKQAERELDETRALLEAVLEASLDGISVYQAMRDECGGIVDFRLLRMNSAGERITGRRREEVVGRTVRKLLPALFDDGGFARWCRVVETGEPIEYEVGLSDQGVPRWFQAQAVRVGDGLAISYSDVTERRRLEDQLRQSQKMEAVGRLAGGVAHDFNNLLTAIHGYAAHLLERFPAGDPSRDDVSEILHAGERAAALTRQLLAFSRRQELALEVLDLNVLVDESERMLRRLIAEDIELVRTGSAGPLLVRGDPSQLHQVVVNLAVNARDAMPEGGSLTIETTRVRLEGGGPEGAPRPPGEWVRLAISDTGIGMDELTRARVFEPFFTTKEPGRGTGLGLASVYGIVHQSGGHVEVTSRLGAGSTFAVYLPAVREEGSAVAPTRTAASPLNVETRGGETVLLAEDEEQIRRLARRTLERAGYRVLDARDGAAACDVALQLAASGEGTLDALVTDVVMPRMGGLELADRLRRTFPALRVLYVSGYGEGVHGARGAKQTRSALLDKPFLPNQLLAALRALLDRDD